MMLTKLTLVFLTLAPCEGSRSWRSGTWGYEPLEQCDFVQWLKEDMGRSRNDTEDKMRTLGDC